MRLHTPVFNEWIAFENEARVLERRVWTSGRRNADPALDDIAAIAELRRKQARDRFEEAMQELHRLTRSSYCDPHNE